MTPNSQRPEIQDLLALNVFEAVEIARAFVGAQSGHLHLGPDMDWAHARLSAVGVDLGPTVAAASGQERDIGLPEGIRKLRLPPGAPTDLVAIGVDIQGPDGAPFAMLRLDKVPTGWANREAVKGLSHATTLLARQLEALAIGPAIVAEPMLRFCTLLRDLDEQAVSQAAFGLLKVLADEQPNRVETMAMRICGLAGSDQPRLEDREVVLSDVALDLIDRAGIGRTSRLLAFTPPPSDGYPQNEIVAPETLAPFAQARIAELAYDVAEDEPSGHLWFRSAGSADKWRPLANGFADGWSAIAAEIYTQTHDILREYGHMHLIRRRDLPTDEIAEAYELDDAIWWLRNNEAGSEARLHEGEWQSIRLEPDLSVKGRALVALLALDGEAVSRLSDKAQDWTRRMAQSVQVVPYTAIAAE